MRISDCSSDVCSSDLPRRHDIVGTGVAGRFVKGDGVDPDQLMDMAAEMDPKPVPVARIGDGPAPAADVEPVRPQPDETAIRKPRPLRQRKRGDHVAAAQIYLHQFRHPPFAAYIPRTAPDRKSVVQGKSVAVCVDLGGRRYLK